VPISQPENRRVAVEGARDPWLDITGQMMEGIAVSHDKLIEASWHLYPTFLGVFLSFVCNCPNKIEK